MTAPSLEAAVAALLKASPGLTSLIGAKVFPVALPDDLTADKLPAITYQRIATVHNSAMGADLDAVRPRVQVSSWAKKYGDAKDVQIQVRKALQRFSGTVADTVIDDIYIDDERDLPREPITGIYHLVTDCLVWYREA